MESVLEPPPRSGFRDAELNIPAFDRVLRCLNGRWRPRVEKTAFFASRRQFVEAAESASPVMPDETLQRSSVRVPGTVPKFYRRICVLFRRRRGSPIHEVRARSGERQRLFSCFAAAPVCNEFIRKSAESRR